MNGLNPDTTLALMNASQSDAANAAGSVKNAAKARQIEQAGEAAQEFEAVFIAEMMKPMFEGISSDGMFGGGQGEEVFRSMLIQEYGKIISQTGSIGIADSVKAEMIRMQEGADQAHMAATTGGQTGTEIE
ncbi:MAG: rod-binding protein [Micavibrio sp.]|nr:rod-binding protein [Micavibrio sp.]